MWGRTKIACGHSWYAVLDGMALRIPNFRAS
jgi:hypothetical protein